MNESVVIALEIYFVAFVTAFFIAVIIKAMQSVLKRIRKRKTAVEESEGGAV